MARAVESLADPVVDAPAAPANYGTPQVDQAEKFEWEQAMKEVIRKRREVKNQVQQLYSLVTGQCTEAMMARVEAHPDYEVTNDARDGVALLRIIRSICFDFQEQKFIQQSVHEALQRFYALKQAKHETVAQYYERFQNQLDVLNQIGASVGSVFLYY